jgi:hypothetical protein
MRDVYIALSVYWVVGMLWLSAGFLPKAWGGWLTVQHESHLLIRVLFVVVGGAVWPLIFAKILYFTCIKGERYTEL